MKELDLFGNSVNDNSNSTNDDERHDISEVEKRFNGQWPFAVATREGFSFAYRRPITYPEAFAIADKYAPQILGRDILLFAPGESAETLYYREKAALVTAKLRRETGSTEQHTPLEAIDKDIKELENLNTNNAPGLTRKKLEELYKVREELEKTEASHRRETEVLLRDWNRELQDLPAIFQKEGASDYHDFALLGKRVMRVRFTHERKAEDITGVDLIYEYHHPEKQIARLAVIQYKLPPKEKKYHYR